MSQQTVGKKWGYAQSTAINEDYTKSIEPLLCAKLAMWLSYRNEFAAYSARSEHPWELWGKYGE